MMHGSKLGQVRIIEAVATSILIFIIFTTIFFMLFSSEKFFKQETVDLNRLAYNILNCLVESGVVEEAIKDGQMDRLKMVSALQNLLPQTMYFKLTISERAGLGNWITISSISNAPEGLFEVSAEVASAIITYTSKNGKIYCFSLCLTRAGLTLMLSDYGGCIV